MCRKIGADREREMAARRGSAHRAREGKIKGQGTALLVSPGLHIGFVRHGVFELGASRGTAIPMAHVLARLPRPMPDDTR